MTIKRVLADIITTQARPLRKKIEIVETRSNMQLADLNSKPHSGKILRNLIYRAIGYRFYPPPG